MTSHFYTPKLRSNATESVVLGPQPFNRDNVMLAFGTHAKGAQVQMSMDGQDLAGKGALVFEGEVLELPNLQ